MSEALRALEDFEVISTITNEVFNHSGIKDKVIAEFLVAIHRSCSSFAQFKSKCQEYDARLSDAFLQTLDKLIKRLKQGTATSEWDKEDVRGDDAGKEAERFPALAIPDDSRWVEKRRQLEEGETSNGKQENDSLKPPYGRTSSESEDEFGRRRRRVSSEEKDRNSNRTGHSEIPKRQRTPSRSPSPSQRSRHADGHRSKRRKTLDSRPTSPSDRYHGQRDHVNAQGRRGNQRKRSLSPVTTPRGKRPRFTETPTLYEVYRGKVTNVKDFGAFVSLEGIRDRREGLVHVSMMKQGVRVTHPSEVVSRGIRVFVKIMSIIGTRISLSMKDVNQETGEDLTPHLKPKPYDADEDDMVGRLGILPASAKLPSDFAKVEVADSSRAGDHSRSINRVSSPERWELKQLLASGVLKPSQYPSYDEDHGPLEYEEIEEELDIEIIEEEPSFLGAKQSKPSSLAQ